MMGLERQPGSHIGKTDEASVALVDQGRAQMRDLVANSEWCVVVTWGADGEPSLGDCAIGVVFQGSSAEYLELMVTAAEAITASAAKTILETQAAHDRGEL